MQKRITIFDTVRGFTMISMAVFHACYDLAYLYGWDMPWFTQTVFQDIWRASISWVFLFIAGWMCTLSRNNAKRAAKYAAAALVVDRNNACIGRRFSELWHHLLHGGVYRCGSRSTTDASEISQHIGHCDMPRSLRSDMGHSEIDLFIPLFGVARISRPQVCFRRLLSNHPVYIHVPHRILCCAYRSKM